MCKIAAAFVAGLALCGAVIAQDEEEAPVLLETETGFFSGWSGNLAFGLYGSDGNTQRLNLRGEVDGARDTDKHLTTFLTTYSYAEDDGTTSENKYNAKLRNDFKLENPEWFIFAQGQLETDQFQDWDQRLSLFAGPGHVFIDDEKTKLIGSVGVGATREFGGTNDDWTPEAIISATVDHKLTERQKVSAGVDLLPNLEDSGEFRANSRVVWELLVDPEVNLSLRAGIEDRYNSNAGAGTKKNDVDFFLMLSWAY
jgi:putative salt-induced outer membrane protein YdiY